MTRSIALLLSLVVAGPAAAADRPHVDVDGPVDPAGTAEDHLLPEDLAGPLRFTPEVYRGAHQLKASRLFVHHVRQGLALFWHGRYDDALGYMQEIDEAFPGSGIGPVMRSVVLQAKMLENFDYRYEKAWNAASADARKALSASLAQPGNEALENLLMTVVSGVEAIHAARRGRYLEALTKAFEAVDWIERSRTAAPAFVDLAFADGLYKYWRTVLAQRSSLIPDFGDHREEGVALVRSVADDGVFLAPGARFALAFGWFEERRYDKAVEELAINAQAYPDNVINTLMLGLAHTYARDFDRAQAAFAHVLALRPDNERVHYYRGLAFQRARRRSRAEESFRTYLAFGDLEDHQEGMVCLRLGQIYEATERPGEAFEMYKRSARVHGDARAKKGMDRLKDKRRAGEISF